jgi:SagB-type dehydrogenase family enzyme
MIHRALISVRRSVTLCQEQAGHVIFEDRIGRMILKEVSPVVFAALQKLTSEGATFDGLASIVIGQGGDSSSIAHLIYYLQRLKQKRMLAYPLVLDGRRLLTIEPMTAGFELQPTLIEPEVPMRLSRFAFCRRDNDEFVLETPLSAARVIIHCPFATGVVQALAQPQSSRKLAVRAAGLDEESISALLAYLSTVDMIARVEEDGTLAEDRASNLMEWEFHDLLFHGRSRRGEHDYPVGAYYRFLGKTEPATAVKPAMAGEIVPLYKPDLHRLFREDPPFSSVLEQRRSIRNYGTHPINLDQLGEFLYRVARLRNLHYAQPEQGDFYDHTDRTYPNGGAAYELEIYVITNICERLPSGIYYYDPEQHNLHKLRDRDSLLKDLLEDASVSSGGSIPQVLLSITSRIRRLSWKYSAIAYATTLKNTGVLYQNMYLVATSMGLAPCALGTGNSSLVAEAFGLDSLVEVPVGEFMLGSAPLEMLCGSTRTRLGQEKRAST